MIAMTILRRSCAALLGAVLLVPWGTSPATSSAPDLLVSMDALSSGSVQGAELKNDGTAAIDAEVLTDGTTGARAVAGWESAPRRGFARLPVSAVSGGPQVILRFAATGAGDALLPRRRPFVFGADVRLRGTQGSVADRGNNVLQRGRFAGDQYKLQVDRGRATCRVAGDRGAVLLQDRRLGLAQVLDRSVWYRLRCEVERSTGDLDVARLRLTVLDVAGGGARESTSAWTRIGTVEPSKHKLDVGGVTPSSTRGNDQLEGDVDRLLVDVR